MHLDDSDIFAYESRLCVASEINDGIDEVARYEDIIEEAVSGHDLLGGSPREHEGRLTSEASGIFETAFRDGLQRWCR